MFSRDPVNQPMSEGRIVLGGANDGVRNQGGIAMARKRRVAVTASERGVSTAVSDLEQDMRALRRAFKAIKLLSPEARRLLQAKIRIVC